LTSFLGEIAETTGAPAVREETFFEHPKDETSRFSFETANRPKEKTKGKDD